MESAQMLEAWKKLMLLHRGCMHQMLTRFGLHPGQPEMLLYVQKNPGCSQRQMAEEAGVTAASIAASFKRMENAGLIKRRSDTADLRCNRVYITLDGEKALAECTETLQFYESVMLQGISDEELQVCLRCMKKVADNLASIRQEPWNME